MAEEEVPSKFGGSKQEQYANATLEAIWKASEVKNDGMRIWEGSLRHTILAIAPKAHVGHVSILLRQSKAIRTLKRGGGGVVSTYEVLRANLWTDLRGIAVTLEAPDYLNPRPTAVLERRQKDLNKVVRELLMEVEAVNNRLLDAMDRICALEVAQGFRAAPEPDPVPKHNPLQILVEEEEAEDE